MRSANLLFAAQIPCLYANKVLFRYKTFVIYCEEADPSRVTVDVVGSVGNFECAKFVCLFVANATYFKGF